MERWREELYHYGTKGMKWGVRRYQNPDGSYTAAGKERYGKGSSNSYGTYEQDIAKLKKYNTKVKKAQSKVSKLKLRSNRAEAKAAKRNAKVHRMNSKLIQWPLHGFRTWVAERKAVRANKQLEHTKYAEIKNDKKIQRYTRKGEKLTQKMLKTYENVTMDQIKADTNKFGSNDYNMRSWTDAINMHVNPGQERKRSHNYLNIKPEHELSKKDLLNELDAFWKEEITNAANEYGSNNKKKRRR